LAESITVKAGVMVEYLLLLGFVILLTATARALFVRQRIRRSLRELALRRRLNFTPTDLIGAYERYQHLELINRGHSRYTWDVLYGTTPHGLVTLFAFACERGLGATRTNQERWIAVLETAGVHSPWRACRSGGGLDAANLTRDGWQFRAEHEHVKLFLEHVDLSPHDDALIPESEWEIQGRLVALVCPYTRDPAVPERLLDEVIRVAAKLNNHEQARAT
jgi:hypothetical protein